MKAICEGKKTKEEVVRESLEMYRDMFNKAEKQVAVLRKVRFYHCHGFDLEQS
jgi:DNA topoisomerase III